MMTKLRHRPVALLLVAAAFPLCAAAQSARPLNPLVARSDRPTGTAPAECEQGLSAAPAMRVEVREIPVPVDETAPAAAAPPSSALRAALQETQNALTRNDRPAFDAALSRELSLVSSYPGGGERRVADDVVRLHETAARLWDAQYRSPFFGEDDPEYRMVSAWPGYAEAVRRSVYTDQGGRRFYPAGESREFVTRLAEERLQRGGMNVSTPATRTVSSAPRPRREVMAPRPNMPRVKRNPVTTSSRSSSRPSSSRSSSRASATPPSSSSSSTSSSTPRPAPTTPAPSSPNPSAPPTVAAAPAPAPAVMTDPEPVTTPTPVAGDLPTAATADTVDTSTTADATTLAESTTTVDATTTDPVPPTASPTRGRSVILPTILILIGLGVLIVLFRASK